MNTKNLFIGLLGGATIGFSFRKLFAEKEGSRIRRQLFRSINKIATLNIGESKKIAAEMMKKLTTTT